MKRFVNFIDRNFKTIVKVLLTIIATILAYNILHSIGTMERGYEAIGGELFGALAIPLFVWLAPSIKDWWKEAKKDFEVVIYK
jgi:uncharacterized membrane protein